MTRPDAAQRLVQLLATDIVGDLLDVIGDADVRDLTLKILHRCRGLASDETEAAKLAQRR